jgi:hypothetical protein
MWRTDPCVPTLASHKAPYWIATDPKGAKPPAVPIGEFEFILGRVIHENRPIPVVSHDCARVGRSLIGRHLLEGVPHLYLCPIW